jgi:hypothetical protein
MRRFENTNPHVRFYRYFSTTQQHCQVHTNVHTISLFQFTCDKNQNRTRYTIMLCNSL